MLHFISIIVCKVLALIGKILGKGSSLPGKVALKICPNILSKLRLPKYVIAFTGSNGKTSSTEMIAEVLRAHGMRVIHNKEGSNQIEGIATLLLKNSSLMGKINADAIVLESDERYARHTFNHFIPTHYVINNLYRDQLTRNAHPLITFEAIKESLHGSKLILNADDPLVCMFDEDKTAVYFSMNENYLSSKTQDYIYNDCAYCPVCGNKMEYSYYHYNHVGHFTCGSCDFKSPPAKYKITDVDLDAATLSIDGSYTINLSLKSLYNAYNILSVYALCRELNVPCDTIISALNNYVLKNDRITGFKVGEKVGKLFTSKHENSVSYNQSINMALNEEIPTTVMIIVDEISRKYYTCESSWLWDIDFERLGTSQNIKNVLLAGEYCYDLELRFRNTEIEYESFIKVPDALEKFKSYDTENLIVITCFSDRGKLLNEVDT